MARLLMWFIIPRHTKGSGVLCYTLWTLSVRPSIVRPSVRASVNAPFPCSHFSIFWPIFFRLCTEIGIGEEWYGIASWLVSFWNNRVMVLDVCQLCFALRFRAVTVTFLPIFCKLCIDIGFGEDWYGIASWIISFRNNRVIALDLCRNCIFGQYFKNK